MDFKVFGARVNILGRRAFDTAPTPRVSDVVVQKIINTHTYTYNIQFAVYTHTHKHIYYLYILWMVTRNGVKWGYIVWRRLHGANKSDTKHWGQMDLLKASSRCSSFQLISLASAAHLIYRRRGGERARAFFRRVQLYYIPYDVGR